MEVCNQPGGSWCKVCCLATGQVWEADINRFKTEMTCLRKVRKRLPRCLSQISQAKHAPCTSESRRNTVARPANSRTAIVTTTMERQGQHAQCARGAVSLQVAESSVSTAIQANPLLSLRKAYVTNSNEGMQCDTSFF